MANELLRDYFLARNNFGMSAGIQYGLAIYIYISVNDYYIISHYISDMVRSVVPVSICIMYYVLCVMS